MHFLDPVLFSKKLIQKYNIKKNAIKNPKKFKKTKKKHNINFYKKKQIKKYKLALKKLKRIKYIYTKIKVNRKLKTNIIKVLTNYRKKIKSKKKLRNKKNIKNKKFFNTHLLTFLKKYNKVTKLVIFKNITEIITDSLKKKFNNRKKQFFRGQIFKGQLPKKRIFMKQLPKKRVMKNFPKKITNFKLASPFNKINFTSQRAFSEFKKLNTPIIKTKNEGQYNFRKKFVKNKKMETLLASSIIKTIFTKNFSLSPIFKKTNKKFGKNQTINKNQRSIFKRNNFSIKKTRFSNSNKMKTMDAITRNKIMQQIYIFV
jgi:hypothetical protein